jgi:hypothetical protein
LRQRFPKPTGPAALYQGGVIVLTNAYLLYLVFTHQTSPVAIAAFNVCELVLLGVIAHLVLIPVPKNQRLGDAQNMGLPQRIGILAVMLVWLAIAYRISLLTDEVHVEQVLHAGGVMSALESLNIVTPLLLSGAAALAGAIGDWSYWRRNGGVFIPQMAMSTGPKILTLLMAPIPAALLSEAFVRAQPEFALIMWSATYLAIKSTMELGMLAWQYAGMPGKEPNKSPSHKGKSKPP